MKVEEEAIFRQSSLRIVTSILTGPKKMFSIKIWVQPKKWTDGDSETEKATQESS